MAQKIIGINHEIETPTTGAIAKFHRLSNIFIDFNSRSVQVNLSSYVSLEKASEGKHPVGSVQVALNLGNADIPSEEQLYQRIVAQPAADPLNPAAINVFAGATLVTE